MNIIIADDDEDKLDQTSAFLATLNPNYRVAVAKSLQSSLRSILEYEFDLAILDMTMPTFDRTLTEEGGRPHAFAGREILRQMKRRGIATPVIVLTSFDRFGEESDYTTLDQLKAELHSDYANYVGTVQLKANVDDWREELQNLIAERIGGANL